MRDLANQSYSQKGAKADPKFLRRVLFLTIGAIAVLTVGKLFFSAGSVISGQSVVLRDAPTGLKPDQAVLVLLKELSVRVPILWILTLIYLILKAIITGCGFMTAPRSCLWII